MAGKKSSSDNGVHITIPLDATTVDDRGGLGSVRVLLRDGSGEVTSKEVKVGKGGKAEVGFDLPGPRALQVIIGPPDATDEELRGLQTLTVDVPRRAWGEKAELTLQPVVIREFWWHFWLRWCREFTVRGRLVCPDGSPVPGAQVCAFDVDRFWWWSSRQQIGCAVTDASGAFTLTFRWCCGWWPWWWWRRRHWQVDPGLAERIREAVEKAPDIPKLPPPQPWPSLDALQPLVSGDAPATDVAMSIDDPSRLEALRPGLLERLPSIPRLESLRIWPWRPWHPWSDCSPDLVFEATQDCGQGAVVVFEEENDDARWNVSQTLDVTLVATGEACCVRPRDPECGDDECVVLTHVCQSLVAHVGGNTGAPPAPAGYRAPGAVATGGDRPFAGVVPIRGICADWIDYYSFEYSADGGSSWTPLPPASTGGITRTYYDPSGPPWFNSVSFPFKDVAGQWVCETLGHWEAMNGPKWWVGDVTYLMRWRTTQPSSPTGPTALFPDATYRLRLRGWRESGGGLTDLGVPHRCGTQEANGVQIRLDNRLVGPGAGHPTTPDHPIGGVHLATTEPDTDIIQVTIIRPDGTHVPVAPCTIVDPEGTLEIVFQADDPAGHLAYYTLHALWGENERKDLLSTHPSQVPSGELTRLTGTAQVGPTYARARAGAGPENTPAAVAPHWEGGRMRLRIPNIREAFPVPCCYLLDLRAYKRTIDGCNDNWPHRNRSTMTFTVG